MKKFLSILLALTFTLSLGACSKENKEVSKWDCSVECMKESTEDSYIINYSDVEITPKAETLVIQNRNNFDIDIHLNSSDSNEEDKVCEIKAGGSCLLHQIKKDGKYKLGCHADVKEGTEIKIIVYDGENSEPY